MASVTVEQVLDLAPQLLRLPTPRIWATFDAEADILYLNFRKPSHADDSELIEDGILIRYEQGEIVDVTIVIAGRRLFRPERRRASGSHDNSNQSSSLVPADPGIPQYAERLPPISGSGEWSAMLSSSRY